MGFRIDKSWANLGAINPVKKKETADAIEALNDRAKQNDQHHQNQDDEQSEKEPTREELEKAIAEMKESVSFKSAGLIIELVVTPQGIKVKMMQATGNVVKVMTGSEFMKLKAMSGIDNASRGKILDTKY